MATSREEWGLFKASLKREMKSAWREISSASTDTVAAEGDIQPIASNAGSNYSKEVLSDGNSHFQYDPLPGDGFTRLLTIKPAEDEDVIQLELTTVDMNSSFGAYEALSYVWGDPDQPKRFVIVNDASLEIYESLSTILRSLRRPYVGEDRVFWVDAICINQNDITERNQQVPKMDRIYQNAWRTVVWLAAGAEVGEESFSMLNDLAQDARALRKTSSLSSPDKANVADGVNSASLPAIIQQYLRREPIDSSKRDLYLGRKDLWLILSSEWWYRAWTLQEILLSTSIILVQGIHEIDWEDFCLAVDHGLRMRLWWFMNSGISVAEEIIPYFLIKSLELKLGFQRGQKPGQTDFGAGGVLELLENCRHREAKDPRDKVYAIFGILQAVQRMRPSSDSIHKICLDPDYTNPVVYVYRMLTEQLVETTQSLDVLGVCPRSTRRGLPSWVTDWSVSGSFAAPLTKDSLDRPRQTHATRGTVARVRFPPDAVTLCLRGHEITKVNSVSHVLGRVPFSQDLRTSKNAETESVREQFKKEFRNAEAYWNTLLEWERFAARNTPQNPGLDDSRLIYWKTLCAGTYDTKDPAKTEGLYYEWLKMMERLQNNEKRFGSFASKITVATYSLQFGSSSGYPEFTPYLECAMERRLGSCEHGWLCLLPDGALKGDSVVLAEGGKVPLVLRPDGDGYYMYIGEAYIHGVMDGEAFQPELLQDIKVC